MSAATVAFAATAVVALLALLFAIDRMALRVIRPPRRPPGRTPADLGLPHLDVTIASELPLSGWLIEPPDDAGGPVVVLAHGWAANSGVMLTLAAALAAAGRPVLLFDYRAHGRSEAGPWVTIRHCRDDTVAAVRWMADRHPGRPIVLGGHSMGGAASILAAAEGAPVDALALVAAPADVFEATTGWMRDMGLGRMAAPLTLVFRPSWAVRLKTSFASLSAERRLRDLEVPVLIVQPESDRRVPIEHAERLSRASGAEVRVVQGASHTDVLEHRETARLLTAFVAEAGAAAAANGG